MITGASGSGKSSLALELMALGARLIADDRTVLIRKDDLILVRCPPGIRGRIEARGVGILAAEALDQAVLHLVVDLDATEKERLPQRREIELLGQNTPLLLATTSGHLPAKVVQYMKGGRVD